MRHIRRITSALLSMLLVAGIALFALVALGPHLFGYRTMTMLTGSMEPYIEPGDVIVAVEKPAEELEVGDVISYHIPVQDRRVETHRVTEVNHTEEQITFRTKGDANDGVDPWTATLEDDTVWETTAVVPYAGTVIREMRSFFALDWVLWGALAGVVLVGLSMIWTRDEESDEAMDDAEGTVPVLVPPLDPTRLNLLAEDLEDARFPMTFASRYLGMLRERVGRIEQALRSSDLDQALDATLSLKVSSHTVGATELEAVATAIESDVRANNVSAAAAHLEELESSADRADRALSDYLTAA